MSSTLAETFTMRFLEQLECLRKHPEMRTLPNVALAVRLGSLSAWSCEDVGNCMEGADIDLELIQDAMRWNWKSGKPCRPSAEQRSYVRRMIAVGCESVRSSSRLLRRLSFVEVPADIKGQQEVFLNAIHSDWRGQLPGEESPAHAVPVNQRATDGEGLLNCRNASVSFPRFSLRDQYAFFVGTLRTRSLPLKAIVGVSNTRFATYRIYGVVRLAECEERIPGRQPAGTLVHEALDLADCDTYLNEWRKLALWLASDDDKDFWCDLSASDPYDRIYCPFRDEKSGWHVRLLWAVPYDYYGENIF